MPPWLVARLEADGRIDRTTRATRRARVVACERCREPIFRGLDADWCALSRDCDPRPLDQLEEALALLNGSRTFELRWLGDHYELDMRDQFRIAGTPALSKVGVDVLVEHDCHRASLGGCAQSMIPPRPGSIPLADSPPF
jgi:hypothetical protein